MLSERATDDINGNVSTTGKKPSINFAKAKGKFCLHCNGDNSYFSIMGKKICNFKADKKMSTIILKFV